MDENIAVVAALSRSRTQGNEAQRQEAERNRQALWAAKVQKRRAAMTFLTRGFGKQALDKLILNQV